MLIYLVMGQTCQNYSKLGKAEKKWDGFHTPGTCFRHQIISCTTKKSWMTVQESHRFMKQELYIQIFWIYGSYLLVVYQFFPWKMLENHMEIRGSRHSFPNDLVGFHYGTNPPIPGLHLLAEGDAAGTQQHDAMSVDDHAYLLLNLLNDIVTDQTHLNYSPCY